VRGLWLPASLLTAALGLLLAASLAGVRFAVWVDATPSPAPAASAATALAAAAPAVTATAAAPAAPPATATAAAPAAPPATATAAAPTAPPATATAAPPTTATATAPTASPATATSAATAQPTGAPPAATGGAATAPARGTAAAAATPAAGQCPCSLWSAAAKPSVESSDDATPVEVGVKLRVQVDGQITAIRFYKGPANAGPHVGHLWSAAGQLLGSAAFTGESASGWQQATFATPVPVSANTTFVASYHAPAGRYAADHSYFEAARAAGPLSALASAPEGGNGVFKYGPSAFPTESYQGSNYWVDVVFTPTGRAAAAASPAPSAPAAGTPAPAATGAAAPAPTAAAPARSPAGSGPGLTVGGLTLSATFNSVGVELLFGGDDNQNGSAALEFRRAGDADWRRGLPLWPTSGADAPGRAFYGSVLLLEPGTRYDVRVTVSDPDGLTGQAIQSGTVATRAEDIPAAASLRPSHYVRADGDDAADGTSESSAWATLGKAVAAAPASAIVQVGPGSYAAPTSPRTTPLTLVAQHPAVDDDRAVVNAGRHSVVEAGLISAPGDAGGAAGGWEPATLSGPGRGGAPAGRSYVLWRRAGVPAEPAWLGYAPTREAPPKRLAVWARKGDDLQTPAGWAEKLYTNRTYNYGWAAFPGAAGGWDVYARLPGDLDPNTQFLTGGGAAGLQVAGPGVRLSGFELRPFAAGVAFAPAATGGVVDHNLIVIGYAGVRFEGDKEASPARYGSDHLIERNLIVDSSLWTADHAASPAIPWCFIKCSVVNADGSVYPSDRIGEGNETAAVFDRGGARRVVFRRNTVDGPFNGITAYNVGFDRYATQDQDVHDNLIRRVADDALEPEQVAINWRMWGNRLEQTATVLSTGPVAYGPLYFFRNQAWRTGKDGVGRTNAGEASVGAVFFKYSGQSSPAARVYVLHNTLWTDATFAGPTDPQRGVDGAGQYAGGGGSPERFYLRNNVVRATRYAWQAGAGFDEDADSFSTADRERGLTAFGKRFTADVAAYRAAYAGATRQQTRTNAGWDPASGAGSFVAPVDGWLRDPGAGDLGPAPGSPLIDGGVAVPNLSDRPGVDYAGTAPDIGAREG
jgi:hypothetical protein